MATSIRSGGRLDNPTLTVTGTGARRARPRSAGPSPPVETTAGCTPPDSSATRTSEGGGVTRNSGPIAVGGGKVTVNPLSFDGPTAGCPGDGYAPARISSAAFSAIASTVALGLAVGSDGITEASTTL